MIHRGITVALLAAAFFLASQLHAADASFKHWRGVIKAVEEARTKRDFQKMREMLEASADEARRLGPASSAENTLNLVGAYTELQMYVDAIRVLDEELERIGPKPVAKKLQVLRGVLMATRSHVYYWSGNYDRALPLAIEAKDVLEDVAGKYHPQLFNLHHTIGVIQLMRKNYAEAESSYQTALKLAESRDIVAQTEWSGAEQEVVFYRTRPSAQGTVTLCAELGDLYLTQEKYKEAEAHFKKSLKTAEAAYGKNCPISALSLQGLAKVDLKMGRRKEFENDTDRMVTVATKTPGLGMWLVNPQWVANPLWQRLDLELNENNKNAAAETARNIAKIFEAQSFETRIMSQRALNLAVTNNQVDWKKAADVHAVVKKASADKFGATSPNHGQFLVESANFGARWKNAEWTDAAYEELAATQRTATEKALLIGALGKVAESKMAQNKKAEALPVYHEIAELLRAKYGDDTRVADAMEKEATLMKEIGQEQQAKELLARVAEVRKKAFSK